MSTTDKILNGMIIFLAILIAFSLGGLFLWKSETKAAMESMAYETTEQEAATEEMQEGTPAEADISEPAIIIGDEGTGETEPSLPGRGEDEGRLLFAGDVLLSDHVLNAYDKAGSINGVLSTKIQEQVKGADLFMVNQEFPFSERGTAADDKEYTFRLPPARVSLMKEMGIDLVTLANNHALDFGTDALLDSVEILDQAGISHVGAGANLAQAKELVVKEIGGKKVGFLGASRVIPVSSWTAGKSTPGMLTAYDSTALVGEIQKARQSCDFVVVYLHWGVEKNEKAQDYQKILGKQCVDAGADLVVGSHPHVLQGIEYYNGKPIVYSLGNFVFGSSIPRTALLQVDLSQDGPKLSLHPLTSSAGFTSTVEDGARREEFYGYMEGLSPGITFDRVSGQLTSSAAP